MKPSEKYKDLMDTLEFNAYSSLFKVRTPRKEDEVFKLECIVGVDKAVNEKDITALSVGFVNSKKELYIIRTFDDTTEIGKKMIKEITDMNKEREQ